MAKTALNRLMCVHRKLGLFCVELMPKELGVVNSWIVETDCGERSSVRGRLNPPRCNYRQVSNPGFKNCKKTPLPHISFQYSPDIL